MRTLVIALIMQSAISAQVPIAILSVVNEVTGDMRLSPGSRALVRLTQSVARDSVTVQVGGRPAGILAPNEERVYIVLPMDLLPGPTTMVVTLRGISTAPFPLTLASHAPALAATHFWPGIYCPVSAPWGTSLV